jgi:hypothetical protein
MKHLPDIPLPTLTDYAVAATAPGSGVGFWAGSSSAALDDDGTFVIAYRVRTGERGRGSNVIARSDNGETLTTVATIEQDRFGAQSLEKPALVRTDDGRWRLYVCPAVPAPSKHWWIDVLEADNLEDFASAEARTVFPRRREHRRQGSSRAAQQRRQLAAMDLLPSTRRARRGRPDDDRIRDEWDGLDWQWHGTVLSPRPGMWDARGTRITTVLPDGRAAYDGRATKEENWFERIGVARIIDSDTGLLEPTNEDAAADARYLDVVPLPGGRYRLYYEARLPDESHELRTELL